MANTFLTKLEMQGFKSFAQKTLLEFPMRVVGIVGPNGSGKSNVIDALRWVLGEREAKQLRGGTLEHLIFSGTPKKAPVGFARVELTFDNSRGEFPMDAPEVSLSRKVDRSGTSHFSLNGEDIRMKDLIPLLARARLGTRGLTIVGQGQSDMFVRSTPEERRTMIEEILGLKEFRIKKSQAERQLANSKTNTEKVKAMLEELLPHVRFLRRQKSKWERRGEIEEELHNLENRYFSLQFHAIQESLSQHTGGSGDKKEEERRSCEDEIKGLEEEIRKIDTATGQGEEAKRIRSDITSLFQEKSRIEKELARVEALIEVSPVPKEGNRGEESFRILQEIRSEISEALSWEDLKKVQSKIREWKDRIERVVSGEEPTPDPKLFSKQEALQKDLRNVDAKIQELRRQEEDISSQQEEMNAKFRKKVELLESKRSLLRKLDQEIQTRQFEVEKIHLRLDELKRDWVNAGREEGELRHLPKNPEPLNVQETERRILRLRGELAAVGEIDPNLVQEAEESEERYAFLTRELEDLSKASEDLQKLIKDLEKKVGKDFETAFNRINDEFNNHFRIMFGGGRARMKLERMAPPSSEENGSEESSPIRNQDSKVPGVEIDVQLPKKKIASLSMLSGGERTLVSIAALFALIAVSPPPFLVLDEVDAALDEENARRFAELVESFSERTQFIIVTHNRATMEAADALYGVTMEDDGVSRLLSLKFESPAGNA